MRKNIFKIAIWLCISLFTFSPAQGQLNLEIQEYFKNFLGDDNGEGGILVKVESGQNDNHARHFIAESIIARTELSGILTELIADNVSSFPLSATAAGARWDLSTGVPTSVTESLGPIFAETGKTLGKNKLILGLNYSYLDLARLRGLPTEDIIFSFTHQDVGGDPNVLGDDPNGNERDIFNIRMGMDVNASIYAIFGTWGIGEKLDIGFAIPVISVDMALNGEAFIDSYTLAAGGEANHRFPSQGSEFTLRQGISRDKASHTGLGDATLRLKYSFVQGEKLNFATLIDARLPTGDVENFTGKGVTTFRIMGIFSQQFGDFTPHLNLGYDYRGGEGEQDADELEFLLGFDQKISSNLTFALDFMGETDLSEVNYEELHAEKTILFPQGLRRNIPRSNIPDWDNDSKYNLAVGFRYALGKADTGNPDQNRLIILANMLVPLNQGGLRSSVVPTTGLAFSF